MAAVGLQLDPNNAQMKASLEESTQAAAAPKSPFSKPDFLAKLATDPRTRGWLGQPDFMRMLRDVQTNMGNMNNYLHDPRFQLVGGGPKGQGGGARGPGPRAWGGGEPSRAQGIWRGGARAQGVGRGGHRGPGCDRLWWSLHLLHLFW